VPPEKEDHYPNKANTASVAREHHEQQHSIAAYRAQQDELATPQDAVGLTVSPR
jgi:hypothetical protein